MLQEGKKRWEPADPPYEGDAREEIAPKSPGADEKKTFQKREGGKLEEGSLERS